MLKPLLHPLGLIAFLTCTSALLALPPEAARQAGDYQRIAQKFLQEGNKGQASEFFAKNAYLYWNHNEVAGATENFRKALELNEEMNNPKAVMLISVNIGLIYSDNEDYTNALPYFRKGLDYARRLKDKPAIASGLVNVATTLQALNQYGESIAPLEEALAIGTELSDLKLLRKCYGTIAESFEETNQADKAFEYYKLFEAIDKKIKRQEMAEVKEEAEKEVNAAQAQKALTEKELSFTSEMLERTSDSLQKAEQLTREQLLAIDLKNAQLNEKDAILAKRRWINIFFASLALFVALVAGLIFYQFRQKKKANLLLAQQNEEIKNQRDKLDRQNKLITSSINYANTIQQAILPIKSVMDQYFESFVVFRPKDIVSGDFYWFSAIPAAKGGNTLVIAAVDCTGHGVPGAFMSMIGSRMLSEIVNERRITDPAAILETLSRETVKALKQDQTDNNDGMDLALCTLSATGAGLWNVAYAGAKRPLLCFAQDAGQIQTIDAERRSIGGLHNVEGKTPFVTRNITLQKGDMLYLSSDGIIDQHGADRKRFGTPRLIETLRRIGSEPVAMQKAKIESILDTFMDGEEQRDDITLIGIRLL